VFPSLWEGFGIPPLEAMACGTPVITSNASSLPEVVGDAGIMVAPTDVGALAAALREVLRDDGLREAMRERGFAQARRFSWRATAERTLRVYEQFC
jgi:glycosyltransferase involved in cell wall biosynthesis